VLRGRVAVRLYAMTCGWLTGATAGFLAGERGRLRVPVPSFLIEHPRGLVLFDSGMHPDAGWTSMRGGSRCS